MNGGGRERGGRGRERGGRGRRAEGSGAPVQKAIVVDADAARAGIYGIEHVVLPLPGWEGASVREWIKG